MQFWLSNLPADTPLKTLVRLAKLRWRIEHDYREMKTGLGPDHFEVRTAPGPASTTTSPAAPSPTPSSPGYAWEKDPAVA
jgi:SRSO17 transposase